VGDGDGLAPMPAQSTAIACVIAPVAFT